MTPISSEFLSRAAAFPVVSCVLVHMSLKIMPLFSDFIVRHDLVTKDIFHCLTIHSLNSPPFHLLAAGREKRKGPMISAGDAEFPRDYHTLAATGGRGARRFPDNSNGGFTSSSLDRRHNSVADKSLEALNSIHKADIERQRDAIMDLQKNKFSNSPSSMSQGSPAAGRQVLSHFLL